MSPLRSLQRGALFQIEDQPIGGIPIQIVAMQLLGAQEAEALVQLQRGRVCDLRLEDNLVGVAGGHGVNGHGDELRGDALAAVRLLHGQHGDVAAEGAGAVGLQLGDDDADEGVGVVESLGVLVDVLSTSTRIVHDGGGRGERTMKHRSPHWYRK